MATRERSSRRRRGSPYYSEVEEDSEVGAYDDFDEMSEDDDVGQFGEHSDRYWRGGSRDAELTTPPSLALFATRPSVPEQTWLRWRF